MPGAKLTLGGARTHYAVDVIDPSHEGEAAARLIFVDTSLRSLSAADPIQNPLEPVGGQLGWLEEMLCTEGHLASTTGAPCTRESDQAAIVISNAPTYSYGPGQGQTALDAAVFEKTLLDNGADLVVSGRIGWNGLYWATAPGVHVPCPGAPYREEPPAPGTRECGGVGGGEDPLSTVEEPSGQDAGDLGGLLPFVVASGAGRFAPDGSGEAPDGFWHGYTIVRLHPSGDPARTIVEQRPLLDWVHLSASEHVVRPGERLTLRGFGREPVGSTASNSNTFTVRDDEISSAAITHRYDLVLADPERPWVPCLVSDAGCRALQARLEVPPKSAGAGTAAGASPGSASASASASTDGAENPCSPYLCLPERVATVDRITGEVRAGNGKYPDTFAVAMLSVADRVATYPLAFTKSPSFVVNPLRLPPPAPGPNPSVPNNPQAPPPPSVPKPNVPQPTLPELPALPGIPPLTAAQPPEPQPPAPPAPPPPTEQPNPLDLTVSPTALTVATPAAVIQPPTPPVNPAPPSGARREARQRQAATQKSGADSDQTSDAHELGGDLAQGKHSPDQAMRRRDRTRPEPSFTPLAQADQPSAWAQGALYTGATALLAFGLAAGWSRGRPTPRQRPPEVPAPAWQHPRRR